MRLSLHNFLGFCFMTFSGIELGYLQRFDPSITLVSHYCIYFPIICFYILLPVCSPLLFLLKRLMSEKGGETPIDVRTVY